MYTLSNMEIPPLLRPHNVKKSDYDKLNFVEKVCMQVSQGLSICMLIGWHLTKCNPKDWVTKPRLGCSRPTVQKGPVKD
jgi:hypothetical protein